MFPSILFIAKKAQFLKHLFPCFHSFEFSHPSIQCVQCNPVQYTFKRMFCIFLSRFPLPATCWEAVQGETVPPTSSHICFSEVPKRFFLPPLLLCENGHLSTGKEKSRLPCSPSRKIKKHGPKYFSQDMGSSNVRTSKKVGSI